jgi:hypothetical protein
MNLVTRSKAIGNEEGKKAIGNEEKEKGIKIR